MGASITRESLLTLEAYARARSEFRARVLAHKRDRTVRLGDHMTLIFEDELTVRYQIQEMLRIEKTFEDRGIQDELDAYVPLIPDGTNLKATMMIEYEDAEVRKTQLSRLRGIENCVYAQVDRDARVHAVADEDLPRANADKTSAVHFLRFEFTPPMIAALKQGSALALGVDHSSYPVPMLEVAAQVRASLARDFASAEA